MNSYLKFSGCRMAGLACVSGQIRQPDPARNPGAEPLGGAQHLDHLLPSPLSGDHRLVDVLGVPSGTKVKCPYTMKIFRVLDVGKGRKLLDSLRAVRYRCGLPESRNFRQFVNPTRKT